jgi:hypothetical protein
MPSVAKLSVAASNWLPAAVLDHALDVIVKPVNVSVIVPAEVKENSTACAWADASVKPRMAAYRMKVFISAPEFQVFIGLAGRPRRGNAGFSLKLSNTRACRLCFNGNQLIVR